MSDEQPELDFEDIRTFSRDFRAVKAEIATTVKGCDDLIERVLIAFFAGGHVLLEGDPGLGKTLLVKCLARTLGLNFRRIQFTPDLMPADILGTEVLVEEKVTGARDLQFRPGPIFTNVLLADEINRATPKTQSALLEAMGEFQVTVFGRRYTLDPPFFVIATQNPIEMEGTYPLPEAQLDRFFFKLITPFPNSAVLSEILDLTTKNVAYEALPQPILCKDELQDNTSEQERLRDEINVLTKNDSPGDQIDERQTRLEALEIEAIETRRLRIERMRQTVRGAVPTPDAVRMVLRLIEGLRRRKLDRKFVDYSPGPRAAQALLLAGKANSLLKEDSPGYTFPEDIQPNVFAALCHRLILNFEAEAQQKSAEAIVNEILNGSK
ncbi:MAG: AAA family ATPase [Planctomycetota bacterium]|nr:AAA family ATPase [Planctomycetota bacterium]MDA1137862.1 AAA family ATPase [Planctomycetota bacterium]